ncbi:MAG: hypothetical protein H6Q18_1138, partial [Bacteroidetes bacterium]|nr:hypothetical protein [Bacteroidota bacterium]
METVRTNEVIEWAKDFLKKAEKEITADELKEQ